MKTKYIKFFSDSQAALKALDNKDVSSRTVWQTHDKLNQLANQARRCTLVWIKAHVGHEGNEEADSLARHATTIIESTLNPPVSHTVIKSMIKEISDTCWQERWRELKTCRQTKQFWNKLSVKQSKKALALNRKDLSRLIQCTTGHNNLMYHSSKKDTSQSPICRLCLEDIETFYHFVTECPRLRIMRQDILRNKQITNTESWSIGRILEFSHIPAIDSLLTQEVG